MAKYDDTVSRKTEAQEAKAFYSNKICAVPMCNNPGTSKNNVTGEGQWYCKYHVHDVNAQTERIEPEPDWREAMIARERANHPERERQPGESKQEFALRSLQFMREKMGMVGK